MPKPTAMMYGFCRDDLMWFEIPKSKDLRLKNTSGKVCRIRVSGGSMTTQEVITELEILVPGNKQWDIEAMGSGIFKVILPSKSDMARLRKVKDLEVDSERKMFFEDWSSKHVDKWGLYDIWVRIKGCPETLCRDYLALFAVGSLIGKATEIDMNFTREHGVVRARIDCVNPQAIPPRLDHYYDGEGFAVYFEVEAPDGSIVPAREFDIGDGENDDRGNPADPNNGSNFGNKSPHGDIISEDDPSLTPDENKSSGDLKGDEMQQDTVEVLSSVQVGKIAVSYRSPVKTMSNNIAAQKHQSVPSKRWYTMVEEDERLEGGSAPPQFSCTQQDRGQSFFGPLQHLLAAAGSRQISEPQLPAGAEKVKKMLSRQQSSLVQ
jgi:hypothetical protein